MVGGREESGSRGSRCQLDVSEEENGEGGREGASMEVISTIMAATSTLPMAIGTLHASVHSIYEW